MFFEFPAQESVQNSMLPTEKQEDVLGRSHISWHNTVNKLMDPRQWGQIKKKICWFRNKFFTLSSISAVEKAPNDPCARRYGLYTADSIPLKEGSDLRYLE
jgi:hypothetical protein